MLEFFFQLYCGNILLGLITFLFCSYLLNKYLGVNVFKIFKEGFANIKKILHQFK